MDRVFLVRPGSDGALALGMIHVLARENLLDRAFLERTPWAGASWSARSCPGTRRTRWPGSPVSPSRTVLVLARAYGQARAPFIRVGGGLSRYGNSAISTRALICLPAAVGAWAEKGGGFLASTGSQDAFDLSSFTRPDLLPGPTRTVNMNRLGHALNELDRPRVMALFVANSNPAAVCPDQNAVLKGLVA